MGDSASGTGVTLDFAKGVAAKWGPAFTQFGLGGDKGPLADLFAEDFKLVMPGDHQLAGIAGPAPIVSKSGGEGKMTWEKFQEGLVAQLKAVNYASTEAVSRGVMHDTMILEYKRTHADGVMYHAGIMQLRFKDGLIFEGVGYI